VRSLSLLAELIYEAPPCRRDPADVTRARKWPDYSHAHGGKDGHPFPVDRETYDRSIAVLIDAVRGARVGEADKRDALKRLAALGRAYNKESLP
jgi:hypothetical protein